MKTRVEVIPIVVGSLCVISTFPKRLKIGVSVKSGHLQKTVDLVLLVYSEQHSNHAERLPAQSTSGALFPFPEKVEVLAD